VTITFSENVTGLTEADLSAPNGTLSNLATADGGKTWTANFTPDVGVALDISNVIGLAAGATVTDLSGNAIDVANSASSASYSIDTFIYTPELAPTQTLNGVTDLGVNSALVIAFNQAITLTQDATPLHIKIFDDMNGSGWVHSNPVTGETVVDTHNNDVDITMVNGQIQSVFIGDLTVPASMVDYTSRFNLASSVSTNGNNLVIDLKQQTPSVAGTGTFSPAFDWDFGSSYHVNFDAGIVKNTTGVANVNGLSDNSLSFTTVTPNDGLTLGSSQVMDATGASTLLSAGYTWVNGNQSIFDNLHLATVLDLANGNFAVVVDSNGGITKSTGLNAFVDVLNFGFDGSVLNVSDILYMDNHGDMTMATTDGVSASGWTSNPATGFTGGSTRTLTGPTYLAEVNIHNIVGTGTSNFPGATGNNTWVAPLNDSAFENSTHYNANVIIFG